MICCRLSQSSSPVCSQMNIINKQELRMLHLTSLPALHTTDIPVMLSHKSEPEETKLAVSVYICKSETHFQNSLKVLHAVCRCEAQSKMLKMKGVIYAAAVLPSKTVKMLTGFLYTVHLCDWSACQIAPPPIYHHWSSECRCVSWS